MYINVLILIYIYNLTDHNILSFKTNCGKKGFKFYLIVYLKSYETW